MISFTNYTIRSAPQTIFKFFSCAFCHCHISIEFQKFFVKIPVFSRSICQSISCAAKQSNARSSVAFSAICPGKSRLPDYPRGDAGRRFSRTHGCGFMRVSKAKRRYTAMIKPFKKQFNCRLYPYSIISNSSYYC